MIALRLALCFPELLPCDRSKDTRENHPRARRQDQPRKTNMENDEPHSLSRFMPQPVAGILIEFRYGTESIIENRKLKSLRLVNVSPPFVERYERP
ncbi:MAG TPA: hypothetical protein VIR01_12070, partial [Pyrinomonadaceae bacterium]